MQEKTILTPEILELENLSKFSKHLCPVCETWHNNNLKKCIFCINHKLKSKNTLVVSFKPLLLNSKKDKESLIINMSLLPNEFKNIFFNPYSLNFLIKLTRENEINKAHQYFDIFLEKIYKIFNIRKIKVFDFKKKYLNAFDLYSEKRTRPFSKRILMPMFNCNVNRRKLINLTVFNFLKT